MTDVPDPVRRTSEIEDPTNLYVVHAIANRLTPLFARLGVPPNAVSLAGMLFGILAGIAYHRYHDLGLAVLGFLLMVGWHVMDGVDGQLARLTRTHSEFGKVLDGACDYVTFGAVYIGLALTLGRQDGAWVWPLVVVSGACHALQSAIYEAQRQDYNFWGSGQASAAFTEPAGRPAAGAGLPIYRRVADGLLGIYLRAQHVALGANSEARRRLATMLTLRPDRAAQVRQEYRAVFAPAVRRWSILSANTRTIAIFLFAAFQRPMYYFWFEIFGLGAILVVLVRWQRSRYAVLFRSLDRRD